MVETILAWVSTYGYAAIFGLLVLGILGLPFLPDETILTFVGYLIHRGVLNPWGAAGAAFGGSLCGITISYALGRTLGLSLLHRYGRHIHVTEERLKRVHDWFERFGGWTLMVGYYVPGVRHFTAYVAGSSYLEYPRFAIFAYAGAFIWCISFITLGYFLGDQWKRVEREVHNYIWYVGVALGVIAAAVLFARMRRSNR